MENQAPTVEIIQISTLKAHEPLLGLKNTLYFLDRHITEFLSR